MLYLAVLGSVAALALVWRHRREARRRQHLSGLFAHMLQARSL